MSLLPSPTTVKWPFLMGDALLVGLAGLLFSAAARPLNSPTVAACVACIAFGAALGVVPFIMDYRAASRLAESSSLSDAVSQIRELEAIAAAVASATSRWQGVHEHAEAAVKSAREVSEKMSAEMQAFTEFLEKANDAERRHLALEVDKLKRAESDWLAVLIRILDHVFAIHAAARRAGQQNVADQLGQFQLACRDAARRVGLAPYEADSGAAFDSDRHQLEEGQTAAAGARVWETVASGFTYRGQLIRLALVRLASPGVVESENPHGAAVEPREPDSPGSTLPKQEAT